ncbi:PspC family transcriptional regulator [Saccharothrix coeruleofusca]|uniref:PspC family transcriptional regulator n=1 Tax=Saccharothrix coeruleofusca TaxID=33919 RepID=A0A918ALW3_9PSEU|nr:PspC family transcriptional regulator [Saccharothrix coeruleofusca]
MSAAGVEETLKDFWASRPRRPHGGRKVAGVAAGIAQRYQIDPVIVRVAFVAMALCNGAGILMYLLGWLCFAQEDDEVSAVESLFGRGRSATPAPLTVLLCLGLLPTSGFFIDGGFTMVGGVLLSVGAVYLLHRGRGQLNRPRPTGGLTGDFTTGVGVTGSEQQTERVTPPAWDPLGAAPFAWDLPEPSGPPPAPEQPAHRPRRPRSRVGAATFALALLVLGGAVISADFDSAYGDWFTAEHTLGLVVAVLGLGLVAGALRGNAGRGLIWLAVPLSAIGLVLTTAGFDDFDNSDRMGDISARPTTAEAVLDEYHTKAGQVELDLTALPATSEVRTEVRVGVGSAVIRVPANADVEVSCENGLGSIECLGEQHDGPKGSVRAEDNGPDGEGGPKVELEVRTNVGSVEVLRG